MLSTKLMQAPIPGENYTTDVRNFPWHRPPEFVTPDEAIEASIEKMMDEENSANYLVMMEMGVSLTDIATMFCLGGVGAGKWSNDVALLIAGPIAHILRIMARANDIEYDMGYENTTKVSKAYMEELMKNRAKKGDIEPFDNENNPAQDLLQDDGVEMDIADTPEEEMAPDIGLMPPSPEVEGGLMGPGVGGI